MDRCRACDAQVPAGSTLYGALRRCPACGLAFAPVELSDGDVRRIYGPGYYAGEEYFDYERDKAVVQKNFSRFVRALARFSPGGRLYEIGAAYGFFLELARTRWQVAGIDVAEAAAAYARDRLGLAVTCGEFLDAPLDEGGYDVVCLWDTIEHLREPDRYVARIARLLRPGGHVALTTGDIGSASARVQGRRWRLIHPPTHLYYFTAAALERLLARHGLAVVHRSHPGFYRSAGTMARGLLLGLGAWGRARYERWAAACWMQRAIYLNLFDIMFVIAQKRGTRETW